MDKEVSLSFCFANFQDKFLYMVDRRLFGKVLDQISKIVWRQIGLLCKKSDRRHSRDTVCRLIVFGEVIVKIIDNLIIYGTPAIKLQVIVNLRVGQYQRDVRDNYLL